MNKSLFFSCSYELHRTKNNQPRHQVATEFILMPGQLVQDTLKFCKNLLLREIKSIWKTESGQKQVPFVIPMYPLCP